MDTQSHPTPDPDFSPSIPSKPASDKPTEPETVPSPEVPNEDELPVPPVFPTA
jgi:hypothetical protein